LGIIYTSLHAREELLEDVNNFENSDFKVGDLISFFIFKKISKKEYIKNLEVCC
jgi:hypothetical protein